ncbi:MAG: hypothetical protein WCQ32_03925, partial [bacterium]
MKFIQTHKTFIYSLLFIVFFSVSVSYATTPSFHTLDPQCAPTDPTCVVSPIVDSSEILYDPITRTLSINPSATYISFIDTGTQSISGNKTFLGNISGINSVAYSFPNTQGTVNTLLINDGNGNLTWTPQTSLALWSTVGNAGTTPGTNFIGTTDAQDFILKANNMDRFHITSTGGVFMQQWQGVSGITFFNYPNTYTNTSGGFVSSTGVNSFVHGIAYSANSSIVASGNNSFVLSVSTTATGSPAARIITSGVASEIVAYDQYGSATASGIGSYIGGTLFDPAGSTVSAIGDGSYIRTWARLTATAYARAPGSMIDGSTSNNNAGTPALLETGVGANGSAVLGGAEIGGTTGAYGLGSIAIGFAGSWANVISGSRTSMSKGSITLGYGHWNNLINDGTGSVVGGCGCATSVYGNGTGSFTWGSYLTNGATNTPYDYSFVLGYNTGSVSSRSFTVGWQGSTVKFLVDDTGVNDNKFVQVGSASISTGTTVASFQNAGGTCTVIPSTSGGI